MRAQSSGDIYDRYAERQTFLFTYRVYFPGDVQIHTADVAVDEQPKVRRIHVTLEVVLVHLNEIGIPVLHILKNRSPISILPTEKTTSVVSLDIVHIEAR